jgi:hypothetical protein
MIRAHDRFQKVARLHPSLLPQEKVQKKFVVRPFDSGALSLLLAPGDGQPAVSPTAFHDRENGSRPIGAAGAGFSRYLRLFAANPFGGPPV